MYCLIKVPDESFPMPTSPISTVTRVFKKFTTPVKLFAQNLGKSEEPAQMNLLIEHSVPSSIEVGVNILIY